MTALEQYRADVLKGHYVELSPGIFMESEGTGIYIVDDIGEVVCWVIDEVAEDPESAWLASLVAVMLATAEGANAVRRNIEDNGATLAAFVLKKALLNNK